MKTTLDIHDALFVRAKRHARKTGRPLRAVVEDGLCLVLAPAPASPKYRLPDWSAERAGKRDPLEAYTWQDLRDLIYGPPEAR